MRTLFLLSLIVAGCSSIPRHVIMAPDVFYIGVPQKIHVALFDVTSPHDVEVALRLPSSSKEISSDHALISAGDPKLLTVKINPEYILDRGDQKQKYIHLFAKCKGPQLRFYSNAKVRLSYQDGVLLIQTDKPIYTPEEKVRLHVIPLGMDLKPSTKKVKFIVKNPQGIAVQQWQGLVNKSGFIHKFIYLGHPAMTGNWTMDAYYGHLLSNKVSVKFGVQEYILPTFSVMVKGPRYILPTDTYFNVSGKAQYGYGKKVAGKVAVRLSILGLQKDPLSVMTYRTLFHESSFTFPVETKHIQNLLQDKWFPDSCRLQVEADVTEKSTGKTERAVENLIYFVTTPYRIEYVNTARYFKPGLPFPIKAKVSYPNKDNAVGVPVKLSVKAYGTSFKSIPTEGRATTNDKGVISFTLQVPRQARRLNIKVETKSQTFKTQNALKNFIAFASESTEMIQLQQIRPAKVGSTIIFDAILMGFNVNHLNYMVVSLGKIVHSATLNKTFGITITISFKVSPLMSPSARLVAYYVSKNTGKIVSDSILLEVEAELPNPIFIVPSHQETVYLPGNPYDLKIVGTVGTTVTLVGVDQTVYYQRNGNILSPGMVFKQLKIFSIDEETSGKNAKDVFQNARMVVISRDMIVNTATRSEGNHGRRSKRSFEELLGRFEEDLIESPMIRQYFPRTWFLEETTIRQSARVEDCRKIRPDFQGKCGSAVLPVSLPDTMTTWVVQAIGVSSSAGFGIAKPLHITTFKSFFIHLSVPYSVQRGEEITILATLFNYKKYDILVYLYLKGDKSFCSVAPPGTSSKLTSSKIKVKRESSVSYAINLLPIKFGEIPIEVTARSFYADDRILKKLLVVPEGEQKSLTQSHVLDPKEYLKNQRRKNQSEVLHFPSIETHMKGIQMNKIKLELPRNAIPTSVIAKIFLKGKITGLFTDLILENIEKLLKLPHGSGVSNMALIGPNVYILYYLTTTKQLTNETENKKYSYIQEGFKHQRNFRGNDHSYSIVRPSNAGSSGSTWLTAFVVKTFCQARQLKSIVIDKSDLCYSVNWILGRQRNDGVYTEGRRVSLLNGGVYTSDVSFTAAVVIALKQCQCGGLIEDVSLQRATTFLEGSIPNITDTYTLAITTYALTLANSTKRFRSNEMLIEKARYNSATSSRYWEAGSKARNIETAGYALLAQVALNRLEYAGPIVVWLKKQRTSLGEFVQAADTCVALESIAKYSKEVEKVKLDLEIKIKNKHRLNLLEANAVLRSETDVSEYLGKEIKITTSGTGVAQMTVEVRYSVPHAKERCNYHLNLTVVHGPNQFFYSTSSLSSKHKRKVRPRRAVKGRRNKKRNMKTRRKKKKNFQKKKISLLKKPPTLDELALTVCTQYKKPGRSGMTVIEVGCLAGYRSSEETLMKLANKENGSISRYRSSDRAVEFFVNEIDSVKPYCITFNMTRVFDVGIIQPVPIKVYDYYEPDAKCTLFYNLGDKQKPVGSCRGEYCRCTQKWCPEPDPDITKISRKRFRHVCRNYDFAIKGQVVYVGEDNMWLTYSIKVTQVINGKNGINVKETIDVRKRHFCNYPSVKRHQIVLFMGKMTHGQYIFDSNSLVKELSHPRDIRDVTELARRIGKGRCKL